MRSFLVALAVDEVTLNRTYQTLPLHLTMLQGFTISSMDAHTVCRVVYEASRGVPPLILRALRHVRLGPRGETEGFLVKKTPELASLHTGLIAGLLPHGLHLFRPEYAYEGYLPHVSNVGPYTFQTGSEHNADCIYTVDVTTFDDGSFHGTIVGRSRLLHPP
jgi:hypothetical protein